MKCGFCLLFDFTFPQNKYCLDFWKLPSVGKTLAMAQMSGDACDSVKIETVICKARFVDFQSHNSIRTVGSGVQNAGN